MASSSPSGAEPVPISAVTASSNFQDGRHSCVSFSPHIRVSWQELFSVSSHIRRQPRNSSSPVCRTNVRDGWEEGIAAASSPASIRPYPCPSDTMPPAAPPEL
eukprot:scaffold30386_cov34-Tisochrysis_lutea.AAC.3